MTAPTRRPDRVPSLPAETILLQLMVADFAVFLAQLVDPAGRPLELAPHVLAWARLAASERRLVLLAPRSHGKSTIVLALVLWQLWRHGRAPLTGRLAAGPLGTFSVLLMSATQTQAAAHLATLRDLIVANLHLFGDLLPTPGKARGRAAWSGTRVRFVTGAEVFVRSFRTSTRGLHPDHLVLDDVVSEQNSGSADQRSRTWRYLAGVLMPMHPGRVTVVGTPLHREDLLFRLGPTAEGAAFGFAWHAFRALDDATRTTLWPERHPYHQLATLREEDPSIFSQEYQVDPRDDAASMFPRELTDRALEQGAGLSFVPWYRPRAGEVALLGLDLAVSEAAGADYTVAIVVAYDAASRGRRVLTIRRERGLDLAAQVQLVRELCAGYGVTVAIIEDNGFQTWLVQELRRYRETVGRVFGHTTGRGRRDPRDGIPGLKLALLGGLWTVPCGDPASRRLARAWQDELAAFGWRDGRLSGTGDHDDLVMASWFVERAVALFEEALRSPREEIVTAEDLGIERYRISPDLDEAERRLGWGDDDAL